MVPSEGRGQRGAEQESPPEHGERWVGGRSPRRCSRGSEGHALCPGATCLSTILTGRKGSSWTMCSVVSSGAACLRCGPQAAYPLGPWPVGGLSTC